MFEQGLLAPVNQNLLTIFIAIATLAILIQTGIVAGLLFATMKMSAQAERATSEARKLFGPAQRAVDALETASVELSRFGATSQHNIREFGARWEDGLRRFKRKIA